jgi:hypothetical protein
MAIKLLCDLCKQEFDRNVVKEPFMPAINGVRLQIHVAVNGTWGVGELCLPCLKRIVAEGVEKP